MNRCGCNPTQEKYEFEIPQSSINNKSGLVLPDRDSSTDIIALKEKIIYDVNNIIAKLECGIQPDLEFLLEEISLIEILTDE